MWEEEELDEEGNLSSGDEADHGQSRAKVPPIQVTCNLRIPRKEESRGSATSRGRHSGHPTE